MKKLPLFVGAFIVFIATSCSKGDAGSAGPQGPAGQDSVIHSAWIPLNLTLEGTYVDNFGNTDTSYYQAITASAITQTILDSGLVVGYISYIDSSGGTTVQNAAPYFDPESFVVGEIDLTTVNQSYPAYNYRYIIVPGEILTTNNILKNYSRQQLRTADYGLIISALAIQDKKTLN